MKITVDTNFLISATQWDYSVAHKLLIKLINSNTEIFTTKEIIEEFIEILERDFKYVKEEARSIAEKILQFLKLVEPTEKLDVVKDDPSDNKIVECAIASNSKYIITYDKKHLLKLKEYKGIKIITPEEMLRILKD